MIQVEEIYRPRKAKRKKQKPRVDTRHWRERNYASWDREECAKQNGPEKDERIRLGLAIGAALYPGVPRSHNEIAALCACSAEAIRKTEMQALAKLRQDHRLDTLRELLQQVADLRRL